MVAPRTDASGGAASSRPDGHPAVRPEVAAEAAVWVARLHGPSRSPQMERECLAWQARSAEHREAFERCTETWQAVPAVTLDHAYAGAASVHAAARPGRASPPRRWAAALGLVALLAGGALLLQQWRGQGVHETGVGEQQLVLLDDGTRMSLNTDTRVRVALDASRRTVEVRGGEALFEVARDPQRPFVVRVAGSEVEALGTTFAVRYTADGAPSAARILAVTLIEGRVAVRHVPGAEGRAGQRPPVLMQAGERVQVPPVEAASAAPKVDHPNVASLLAWKRSEAVFDDAVLADAVAEMNRYSRTPIVLLDAPALAGLRVSGLYRTGDIAGFARAVAALHGLALRQGPGRLELAKPQ